MRHGFPSHVVSAAYQAGDEISESEVYLLPDISDGSDGDLTLYWTIGDLSASLSFERDGSISGYAFKAGMKVPWEMDSSIGAAVDLSGLVETLKNY